MQSFSTYKLYPYGMLMPNRHSSGGDYDYGFQGELVDDEIKGEGNSVNYKYRMHDPRIGRFFAVDPLAPKYPHNSPYAFSENRVIDGIELEGLEVQLFNKNNKLIEVDLGPVNDAGIQAYAQLNQLTYLGYYLASSGSDVVYRNTKHEVVPTISELFKPITNDHKMVGKEAEEFIKNRDGDMVSPALYKKEIFEEFENTIIGDFAKIGQGLTYGPEAVALCIAPELVLAKLVSYVPKIQKALATVSELMEVFKPVNEFDNMVPLYRGTTGSEGGGTMLFATDDPIVAASYAKEGYPVVQFEISQSGLKTLEASGKLTYRTGTNGATGKVSTEFVFEGNELREALNAIAKPVD